MLIVPGMRIRIGPGPDVRPTAVGVVFQVDLGKTTDFFIGKVLEAPSGWGSPSIWHRFDPNYDEVLDGDNEAFRTLLKSEDSSPPIRLE